jgi:hypothetical protein
VSTADETTSRVSQQSGKSMATVYQQSPKRGETPGQRHLHYSPEMSVPNTDSSTRDDFRDCSETPPRPFRDQCQTVGRLVLRIRHEMLEQETRQRTQSERMPEPLLTLKEAADYLRLTPAALYTQRHRGDKPGALGIRVGRKILYRPSDIDRFLDEQLERSRYR